MDKCIILLSKELTDEIIKDCIKTLFIDSESHTEGEVTDEYFIKTKNLYISYNKDKTKVMIRYRGSKPKSCEKYDTFDWEDEKNNQEWISIEGID